MINRHSIDIKAAPSEIFRELVLWGESKWWPAGSPMRYTRLTPGGIGVGTRYRQKVRVPFGPEWDVEIASLSPDREVAKRFLNGMFRGVEREYIVPADGACQVHFLMDFEVVGGLNRLMWEAVFKKRHDVNLGLILNSLKGFLEG